MDTITQTTGRSGPAWSLNTPLPAALAAGHKEPARLAVRPPAQRFAPEQVAENLGLLAPLAGTWEGTGFNLIARPDFHDKADLFLQLNRTREVLKFDPIGSPIPNRGFGQDDIELFGLTYLQKIQDFHSDAALHIEPGIWVKQPATTAPPESAPPGAQLVSRMGSIPHGNAILAQGIAAPFSGTPVLAVPGTPYNGSKFLSFNSTPIAAPPTVPATAPPTFSAAGSSAAGTAAANPGVVPVFNEYDLGHPAGPGNPRSPFDDTDPDPVIAAGGPVDGVPLQDVINDPVRLLQAAVEHQVKEGYAFEGTALNIATLTEIDFFTTPNSVVTGPTTPVTLPDFGGGAENIDFLFDTNTTPVSGNAQTAVIYATFWIEHLTHKKTGHRLLQLQYAQMVTLNFPVRSLLPGAFVNLGWPHITVGTLRKSFG